MNLQRNVFVPSCESLDVKSDTEGAIVALVDRFGQILGLEMAQCELSIAQHTAVFATGC